MPRFRALFLLGLFVVNQAACTSWQVPKVTPQAYAAQHTEDVEQRTDSTATFVIDGRPIYDQPNDRGETPNDRAKMRVTLKGEQGNPQGKVVLTGVRFSGDSVLGRDPKGQPTAYSLRHVTMFEVRGKDGVRTAFAVLGIGLAAFLGIGAIAACATPDDYVC